MKNKAEKFLLELGCGPHIRGYDYTVSACVIIGKNPNIVQHVTTELYPQIAKEYDTTPARVERAIRHAIEYTFNNIDFDLMKKVFGNTVSAQRGKPTNSHFIVAISNYIRRVDNEKGR